MKWFIKYGCVDGVVEYDSKTDDLHLFRMEFATLARAIELWLSRQPAGTLVPLTPTH